MSKPSNWVQRGTEPLDRDLGEELLENIVIPPLDNAELPDQEKGTPTPTTQQPSEGDVHPDVDQNLVWEMKEEQRLLFSRWLPSPLATFISGNLIPDEIFPDTKVLGQRLTPSVEVVRGAKFLLMTFALIAFCRAYVREARMEIDENIDLDDFKEYYFLPCLCDSLVFFVVGRLQFRRGCDCLYMLLPTALGACFMSWLGYIPALNTSFTKDSIENQWTEETWIYTLSLASIVIAIVVALWVQAFKEGILFTRLCEFVAVSLLAIKPLLHSPEFHPHHWFLAILIGAHVNQRFWWSLMLQFFMWGVYINGIAVYGRDGLLGCEEIEYRAKDLHCSYHDDDTPW